MYYPFSSRFFLQFFFYMFQVVFICDLFDFSKLDANKDLLDIILWISNNSIGVMVLLYGGTSRPSRFHCARSIYICYDDQTLVQIQRIFESEKKQSP